MTQALHNKTWCTRVQHRIALTEPAKSIAVFSMTGQMDHTLWASRLEGLSERAEISWLESDRVRTVVRQVIHEGPDNAVHPLADDLEASLRLLRCLAAFSPRPRIIVLSDTHSKELETSVRQLGGVIYLVWPDDRGDLHDLLMSHTEAKPPNSGRKAIQPYRLA